MNSTTHGVGLVLSVAGFVVLLAMAIGHGTAWHVVGCAIYGSTLICLYPASTLYHGIPLPRLKRVLKIFDHSAIYLLIAGTYTPFLLVNLGLYLAMGWLVVVAARPLVTHVSAAGLRWLVAGGIIYTVGVVFFASRKIPYGHSVWHVFVMLGSFCHYLAVLYGVVLPTKI